MSEVTERIHRALLARQGEARPQPRLSAVRRVMELLGDPQLSYPVIQVAGTNGKSSTSRIIESLLRAHGLRTGLYTSPHLIDFSERIAIDGSPIAEEALATAWAELSPILELVDQELSAHGEARLSYFEAMTVLAFVAFADAPVHVVVLEVGMGGEWDATNVAEAQVAVFTPIDMDHMAFLGSTLAEIARTKSKIIEPESIVVSASQRPEALTELTATASEQDARLLLQGRDFGVERSILAVGGQVLTVRGLAAEYEDFFLPLHGAHQADNAAVAIAAVEAFFGAQSPLGEDVLREGLGRAVSPGRLELVAAEPPVFVDAAHNPHGAAALARAIGEAFAFDELALVIGALEDKDVDGIAAALAPLATVAVPTASDSPRARTVDDVAQALHAARPGLELLAGGPVSEALAEARDWAAQDDGRAVLVAGSITVIGEVMQILAAERAGHEEGGPRSPDAAGVADPLDELDDDPDDDPDELDDPDDDADEEGRP